MNLVEKTIVTTTVKSLFGGLKEAYQFYAQYRVKVFLSTIDSEIELMSAERQAEINEVLDHKNTKKVLADFAATITNTSSEVVLRALAFLFIKDPQFKFTEQETTRFISCTKGLDDLKVEFLLKLGKLNKLELDVVYPIYTVNNCNFTELFLDVEVDEFFAYIEDFLKRGLILRDPRSDSGSNFYSPSKGDWSVLFGISPTLQRYISLLEKAKYLQGK